LIIGSPAKPIIDVAKCAEHAQDAEYFHLPEFMVPKFLGEHGYIDLPKIGPYDIFGYGVEFQITKFMVLEVVAALLMLIIFIPMAWKLSSGKPAKGRFWNLMEAMVLFVRDDMVRPAIGGKQADRFVPFILTLFFFILFCNLLGMLPWAGSPTGSFSVTAPLALIAFGAVAGTGMKKFGPVGFWTGLAPHMELPLVLAVFLKPMILLIEIGGLFIKHTILAVRLLANMFAGHLVLAVILGFITSELILEWHIAAWTGVMVASICGAMALSLLELFVAFLQAYIFAFLTALFIGMAVHQH
jgi:F-type H+-transporting ATPase subunit a